MTVWSGGDYTGKGFPSEAARELREGVGEGLVLGGEPRGEILFGQPDPQKALAVPELKWIQVTSAGYTRYDTPEFREALRAKGATLTNSSSVFDEPCAQHLLAFLLAFARRLPEARDEQNGGRDWSVERRRLDSRLLQDGKLLIVGYGAIARRLVELLKPFGMSIVAVRRAPKGDEAVPTFPIDELDRLLPEADYVANILPANADTDGLFGRAEFARMKDGAFFTNIGRGTTVDEDALMAALDRLAGAYLDVTDPEPLPKDSPLWSAPKVFITPHTAGGHRGEEVRLVRHLLENLVRFRKGETLADRVM